jgi:hypothetical protein
MTTCPLALHTCHKHRRDLANERPSWRADPSPAEHTRSRQAGSPRPQASRFRLIFPITNSHVALSPVGETVPRRRWQPEPGARCCCRGVPLGAVKCGKPRSRAHGTWPLVGAPWQGSPLASDVSRGVSRRLVRGTFAGHSVWEEHTGGAAAPHVLACRAIVVSGSLACSRPERCTCCMVAFAWQGTLGGSAGRKLGKGCVFLCARFKAP